MVNYYEVLELSRSATCKELEEELKKVQRKWVNRTNAPDLRRRQEAENKVKLIEEAQKILIDQVKRNQYDAELANEIKDVKPQPNIDLNTNVDVDYLIEHAERNLHNHQYAEAIIYGRKATELAINNADAWRVLGSAYKGWNDPNLAVDCFKKALNIQPNSAYLCFLLADLYYTHDALSDAELYVQRGLSIEPNHKGLKWMTADILSAKGDYNKSIDVLMELLSIEPNNEQLKSDIAWKYYNKGLSHCYYNQNNELYYNVAKEATENMIECMHQAKEYLTHPRFDEMINWGNTALKKSFDTSLWSLFILPGILMLLGFGGGEPSLGVIGALICIPLLYLCFRPGWQMTRKNLFNEKTFVDYLAVFSKWAGAAIGAIITFIFSIAMSMLRNS